MGAIDAEAKAYFSKPEYFGDLFNFWIYKGRQVIKPEELTELDTTEIVLPYNENSKENSKAPTQKFRDILKLYAAKFDKRAIYVILGLELQTATNYAMPVRNMLYDAMNYARQISEISTGHRKDKDMRTKEEFLSGLKKEDKLKPVVTLTLSLSGEEWDGPTSLYEMLDTADEEILSYVQDYKLNILSPAQIDDNEFDKFKTEIAAVMEFVKHKYDKNMDWMKDSRFINNINYSTGSLIQALTGVKLRKKKKGDVNAMWPAWENGLKEARDKGRNEGRNEGRIEGRNETIINSIKNLKESLGWSIKQIMDAMKIPLDEQEKYAKQLG